MERTLPQTGPDNRNPDTNVIPGPWPWYALLFIGYTLTGFFPWLMTARGLYRRNRKWAAATAAGVNLALLIGASWWVLTSNMVWWRLSVLALSLNLVWTATAIVYQKLMFGSAPRRYHLKEWKSWVRPIVIGLIIGFCAGTISSIGPAFETRPPMQETMDSLDRQTVLWDFFIYTPIGLMGGLVLGLWWAGERKRFNVSHVITYLAALALTILGWYLLWALLVFVLHKGIDGVSFMADKSNWAAIPPWVSGPRKFLIDMGKYDIWLLIIVPLLFGAPSRMRDFAKRSLLVPLLFIITLPGVFTSNIWWETIQDQIIYEMNSYDPDTQASAHKLAGTLITRYPNHLKWPLIAEKLAQFHYQNGNFEQAGSIYKKLIDRYKGSHQWHWSVKRARAAIDNPDFGKPGVITRLDIPMVDYQKYLTHNWMALLSVVRYWEGADISESEVVIKLKDLSKSSDEIKLNPIVNLAGLDDAVRSFGYEMVLFPSNLNRIQALIDAGIPVIHQRYKSFDILFGKDNSRSAVSAYSFSRLSWRLRNEKRKEAGEILAIAKEGHGESRKRLERIANESYIEYGVDYWQKQSLRYMGPVSAIVFPGDKVEAVAKAMNMSFKELKGQSDGYLAALIALSFLDHGDPVYSIEWAKIGAGKTSDPLPYYVAHLAGRWWKSRDKITRTSLNLQSQLPDLAQIFDYFNAPDNQKFLQSAQQRFEPGFKDDILPWMIMQRYLPMMDRSDPGEMKQILSLMHKRIAYNPASPLDWVFLANLYEWSEDITGTINALTGAVSSDPLDSKTKLRLAFSHIRLEQYEKAERLMGEIDPSQVRYNADYYFCQAVLAEWKGNADRAMDKYAKAIEMRRYKPIYHLRYGKLLLEQGLEEKAGTYLEWAARIDADNTFKKEAVRLLSSLKK